MAPARAEDNEETNDPIVAFGNLAVVYSEKGGDALPRDEDDPSRPVLIDGDIQQGIRLYEVYEENGGFDRVRPRTDGSKIVFEAEGPNLG